MARDADGPKLTPEQVREFRFEMDGPAVANGLLTAGRAGLEAATSC